MQYELVTKETESRYVLNVHAHISAKLNGNSFDFALSNSSFELK